MERRIYPTDLSDQESAIPAPLVPIPKTTGRPATISRRALLNAMFYSATIGPKPNNRDTGGKVGATVVKDLRPFAALLGKTQPQSSMSG